MTPLRQLLEQYRQLSPTERDKGTAFERLTIAYMQTEPLYKEEYQEILLYPDWVKKYGGQYGVVNQTDTGIDLVAKTHDGEFHAIQCKNLDPQKIINKSDIDSFFTASGKKYFSYRLIFTATDKWSKNAEEALPDQHIPVAQITLHDLENSVIDWTQFYLGQTPILKAKKSLRKHQTEALAKVKAGFASGATRGKMIMACGTGKTFTALRIAEDLTGKGKRVLFLVPSLSLLSQTLREWTQDSEIPLINFAVCSDSEVGKKEWRMMMTGFLCVRVIYNFRQPPMPKVLPMLLPPARQKMTGQ